ncbi:class I SAM-dependent methyltransferase, partial [Belnapia sp. F-4-1]|uniref:class I SAM-dependent methyltransferase n=1 Tax=Belnapia sp. F-4-1 TaxID=1545443 RepID=UPI0019174C24
MRTLEFRQRSHNRYWWYHLQDSDYVPPVFGALSEPEWALMQAWFADTEAKFPSPGEISVPGLPLLNGIVAGNGLGAVVQLGHYVGYSTLMLGFALRRMGRQRALFSIDIDAGVTAYTQAWIDRAGLGEVVRLHVGDSSDPAAAAAAAEWLPPPPPPP